MSRSSRTWASYKRSKPVGPTLEADGPAKAAGLREGDILVSLDTHAVTSLDDVHRWLTEDRIGLRAILGVLRGAERLDLALTVADRKA